MNHVRLTALIAGCMIGAGYTALWYIPQDSVALSAASCNELSTEAPSVTAEAAFVADISTGNILYQKNAEAQLPLASLTKLMTVVTALEALGPDHEVHITEAALSPEGDSGLTRGERWSAQDLAHFSLIESSNDGAHALGLAVVDALGLETGGFIDTMNRRARLLGLAQTFFLDDTGLDISLTTAGAYGSARDAATLLAHIAILSPESVERSVMPTWSFVSKSGTVHQAENTTLLASLYPSAIGSKTGYTDLAGGNLAFMFEAIPGHPVVIAVLGSTREGREVDTVRLATFAKNEVLRQATCLSLW